MVRLKTLRDHVVVAGLGRSGMLFAQAFRKTRAPVVVIETNENDEYIANCANAGVFIVMGDARYPDILLKAGVDRARVLICTAGEDGANAEIAVQTRSLLKKGRAPMTALVHIIDSHLCRLLRRHELMGRNNPLRIEFFNIYETAVRDLFATHAPFDGNGNPNLLIIGLGQMGESLLLALSREWMHERPHTPDRLTVAVLDRSAAAKIESLHIRYPYLISNCNIRAVEMVVPSTGFYQKSFLTGLAPDAVYVCFDHDSLVLSTALLLRQWLPATTPIFARMSHQGGLATLLNRPAKGEEDRADLIPFGAAERICTPDLLAGGTKEILAKIIHEEYVQSQIREGVSPQTNPALRGWSEIPEWQKESNRAQADHIGEKLRRIQCDIVLFSDENALHFQFDEKEVEVLARMEHERWIEERMGDGWKYAAEKNAQKKTSPYLVSYDQLPEQVKEYNRNTVRELPRFLARAGYQIYRI